MPPQGPLHLALLCLICKLEASRAKQRGCLAPRGSARRSPVDVTPAAGAVKRPAGRSTQGSRTGGTSCSLPTASPAPPALWSQGGVAPTIGRAAMQKLVATPDSRNLIIPKPVSGQKLALRPPASCEARLCAPLPSSSYRPTTQWAGPGHSQPRKAGTRNSVPKMSGPELPFCLLVPLNAAGCWIPLPL